jgi:hypothetical protein
VTGSGAKGTDAGELATAPPRRWDGDDDVDQVAVEASLERRRRGLEGGVRKVCRDSFVVAEAFPAVGGTHPAGSRRGPDSHPCATCASASEVALAPPSWRARGRALPPHCEQAYAARPTSAGQPQPEEHGALVLGESWEAYRLASILLAPAAMIDAPPGPVDIDFVHASRSPTEEESLARQRADELHRIGVGGLGDRPLTREQALSRLPGMTEEMFERAWGAFFVRLTGADGFWDVVPGPGPIALLGDPDQRGRPVSAVLCDPWEILSLDTPRYRRLVRSVEKARAAYSDAMLEWSLISQPLPIPAALEAAVAAYSAALNALREEVRREHRPALSPTTAQAGIAPVVRSSRPVVDPLPAIVKFPADRVHGGTVQALARAAEWTRDVVDGFHRGLQVVDGKNYRQFVGFRTNPGELWDFLMSRGESAIKAHYALWARCYEATGGDPGKYVALSVPQFCDDLGYHKHCKGGHRPERKREALRLLEVLTTAEIAVIWRVGRKERRLRGPLWHRGVEGEERDGYGDLFGSARVGDRGLWDPVFFTYKPGPWFEDEEWRRLNSCVGLVGLGLLHLDNRNDRWAIRIGGYYGTLARIGQYRQRTISVATVLCRTGLDKLNVRNPAEQLRAFERAHDRLVEVGVLKDWQLGTEPVTDEPDMDDPATLVSLADYGAGDWRRQRVVVTWPDPLTEHTPRLEEARRVAIATASRKARRHRGNTPAPATPPGS